MTLLESSEDETNAERLDLTRVQAELDKLVRGQEKLHEELLKCLTANRSMMRVSANKSTVSNFEGGNYVMAARCENKGLCPN